MFSGVAFTCFFAWFRCLHHKMLRLNNIIINDSLSLDSRVKDREHKIHS